MKFKENTLENGLSIISIPQKDAQTATILILVEAGSKYETKNINGISHFLEHMCFKGTKKRQKAIQISSELDSLGAKYNAFTGHEYTGYYAKVNPRHIEKAVDIVSDIYLNQIFNSYEIKKESGVIIEEINMYEDDPKRKIHEIFTTLLYKDQPAGWDIAGDKKTVLSLTKKDFIEYRKKHYVASATSVIVAGKFDERKVVNEIKKRFEKISTDKKEGKEPISENQKKPEMFIMQKKSDQTHMVIGVRTFSVQDKRAATLKVISGILGGGMSSRLFSTIRDKMGAAYYVYSYPDFYTDHGYFAVSVGAGNEKAMNVLNAVLKEFRILKNKKVDKKELKKVKDYLIGNVSMNLETSDEMALFYGSQKVLREKIRNPKDIIKDIEGVTQNDIQKLSKEIFDNKNLNLALIGPVNDENKFESVLLI